MSAPVIPGVATDGLKPADLLWASLLDKPLLFPPSAHSHGAGDLPVNIAFKDQANTFIADQNFLLGNSAINLATSGWPAIAMRHTGQGENKFVSPAGDVYHNQSADTVWSTNVGVENFRISNVGNVTARGTLTLSGANAVISASGNDGYVAGHWNASYGVWCGGTWLGARAHGMTYGAGGELELQASAIKRVTIGNDYATKFYNSSGIATVLINGTAGTITTLNGSGSSVNITTNENAGYAGTPIYTDLNFCGYGGGVNGRIRMSDISASSPYSGPMQFFTRFSSDTIERMRISADGHMLIGTTSDNGAKLQVAGNITATGRLEINGDDYPSGSKLSMGSFHTGDYDWIQSFASTPLRINPLGNAVSIGSTLEVASNITSYGRILSGSSAVAGSMDYYHNDYGRYIWRSAVDGNGKLNFGYNDGGGVYADRLTLLSDGNMIASGNIEQGEGSGTNRIIMSGLNSTYRTAFENNYNSERSFAIMHGGYDLFSAKAGGYYNITVGNIDSQEIDLNAYKIVTRGNVNIKGNVGGWSKRYGFLGSAGTDLGGFGMGGTNDGRDFFWIGNSYSDFYIKHDGYTLQSKSLNINTTGSAGGWGSQHGFTGSGGADLGGYGAVGNTNTIDHYWIGPNFTDPNVVITSAGMRVYGTSGAGHIGISRALSSNTGYVEWFRGSGQSNPGARQGYMGYDSGNDISIQNEQGGYFKTNSMMVAGATTASGGTRILAPTYDGNLPGHFVGGLVTERSSIAVGLAWGMYQEGTASWLSGWDYASAPRSALLLGTVGLRMISTASTSSIPGVALPSQPTEVFTVSTTGAAMFGGNVTVSSAAPLLRIDTTNNAASTGIEWTSSLGGQFEASIKHIVNSGDMEINVGRGVGWGGALKVVLDTSLVIDATSAGIGINRAASGYALDVYRPATGVIARFENTVGSQVIFQDAGGGGVMTPGLSGWYVTDTIGSYLGSGNGRVTIANSNGNITTNGSVGIGLDTLLNAKLNVHGAGYQIKLSGVDIDNPGFVGVGSNEKMYLTDWLTTTKGIMIDLTNGNVSVGSLYDTGYKLQVAGGIYAVGNIHAEVEQNSAVQSVIRNNSNGSLSYSRFLLNAYGNSWSMGMGSAANNSNAFEIRDDALGADNLRMSMAVGGAISVTNNVWHKSLDGQSRFYYGSNSSNYYRANGSHIFRNGSDTDVAEISSAGTATFDGSVRAKAGYYHIDTGGTARWLTYSPGVDVSWYIRDAVNSRMQVTYSPGATSAIANTLFGSKVEVEGGQLTVSGSVNSAVSLFPTYGLGSSVLDFKAIGSTNQDARMASGVGSSSNIVFYTGGATLVERGRFVDTGLDVTGNFTASGSFSASGNVGIGSGATLSNARMSLGTAFGNQILLYDNAIGGGYGFGIQASLLQIFCNDSADSVSIGYGKSTSFTPALTTTGTNVSITGHVTSVIQSLSTDPTGSDLASGQTRTIKNTSTGTTKVWLNDGGTFKSLTFV